MKKILCLILALTLACSLVACGNPGDDSTQPTESNPIETTTPVTPAPSQLVFMDYGKPGLGPFVYRHEILNGYDRMITDTCFTFDVIDMYAALQNTSFFNESGRNLTMTIGEEAKFYHLNLPMYIFGNTISGEIGGTEENPDFTINLSSLHQTAYFYTPNVISLTITYNPEADDYLSKIQTYPHEVLSSLVDILFANYVVYGKDSDGLNYNCDEDDPILPNDLSEKVENDNGAYIFCRTFGDGYVTYEIFFEEERALSDTILVGRPVETTAYDELPYDINDMVTAGFGDTDVHHIDTFGNNVFTGVNSEYTAPLIDSLRYYKTYGNTGVEYFIGLTAACMEEEHTYFDYIGTYTISEDKIVESDLYGYFAITGNEDGKRIDEEKRLISVISNLLPEATITRVGEVEDNLVEYTIQYTYLGVSSEKTMLVYVTDVFAETDILPLGADSSHNHNHNHTH